MEHKIGIKNNQFARNHNRDFNTKMRSISDEVFQTEETFPAGYMPVMIYKEEHIRFSANRDAPNNITSPVAKEKFDEKWSRLSEYETIIASHLLYGSYNTYIFSGGMGSGKTSTASHVLEFIQERYTSPGSAFIKINFDFNVKVNDEDKSQSGILSRFTDQMYNKLKVKIFHFIRHHRTDLLLNFVSFLERIEFDEYDEYFDFRQVVNFEWVNKTPEEKAQAFFGFVEKAEKRVTRIEMLMKFLRFLRDDLAENEFIVIFYDNIDILEPAVQQEIFTQFILPFNRIALAKCLISLRRTTFVRNFDYTDSQFARSFGFIHHHGHQTSDIILERLIYYVRNIDNLPLFRDIEPAYRQAIKNRLQFLESEFSTTMSQFHVGYFLNSLSGNSVRLGLYMANRLLINNVIRFDENPAIKGWYKKALIVNDETNLLLSDRDEVINLFSVKERFSFLPVKILLHIHRASKESLPLRIADITDDPVISQFYAEGEVKDVLSSMMYSRRPLLWMDKVHASSAFNNDSNLYITEIGYGYLDFVIKDLFYVQECFLVVKWDSDDVPLSVNVQSDPERMDTVLKCLRVAFDNELDDWETDADTDISELFISPVIIEKVAATMIALYGHHEKLMNDLYALITYILEVKKIYFQPMYDIQEDLEGIRLRRR